MWRKKRLIFCFKNVTLGAMSVMSAVHEQSRTQKDAPSVNHSRIWGGQQGLDLFVWHTCVEYSCSNIHCC